MHRRGCGFEPHPLHFEGGFIMKKRLRKKQGLGEFLPSAIRIIPDLNFEIRVGDDERTAYDAYWDKWLNPVLTSEDGRLLIPYGVSNSIIELCVCSCRRCKPSHLKLGTEDIEHLLPYAKETAGEEVSLQLIDVQKEWPSIYRPRGGPAVRVTKKGKS